MRTRIANPPFGGGTRLCIDARFALSEARLRADAPKKGVEAEPQK